MSSKFYEMKTFKMHPIGQGGFNEGPALQMASSAALGLIFFWFFLNTYSGLFFARLCVCIFTFCLH